MDWNDYIYPIELDYNKQLLAKTVARIKNWPMYSADRGKTFFSTHRDIYFPINAEAIKIKNSLIQSTTFSFSCVQPGNQTGWHFDANRGCTLILPIDSNPHLIRFKIDNQELDYYYTGPVLTNANVMHNGINHLKQDRYNLLFHFDDSYQNVISSVKDGKFVTIWNQDYNICLLCDFPIIKQYYNTHSDQNTASVIITDDKELAERSNVFTILLGSKSDRVTSITFDQSDEIDIMDAIKFILYSSSTIQHIGLK